MPKLDEKSAALGAAGGVAAFWLWQNRDDFTNGDSSSRPLETTRSSQKRRNGPYR